MFSCKEQVQPISKVNVLVFKPIVESSVFYLSFEFSDILCVRLVYAYHTLSLERLIYSSTYAKC